MSRRKQPNPKAIKGEKDAMQPEQEANSDMKCQQDCHDASYLSAKDNSDFEDDSQRLVIDTSQILPLSPSLTSGRTVSDDVDHVTETSVVIVSNGDMSVVEQEVVEEDVATSKSRRGSVSSNVMEKDNMSVSDCNSNGALSLNLSSSSVTDMTLLSDGSGMLKNSKSRKKSDLILPKPGNNGEENFSCPICEEVLPNNHEFTCHIRSHNSPTNASTINSCTICGKVLSSQSSLDRHMLVHSGERPFRCKVCEMAFTTNGNMHRHMRIHEKNFQSINGAVLPNGSVVKPRRKKKLLLEKRDPASAHGLPLEKMADVHLALWIQNGQSALSGGGRKRKLDVAEDDGLPKEQSSKKVIQEMGPVPKRLVLTSRNPSGVRKRSLIRTMKLLPLATTFQRISSIDPSRSPMKCSECQQKFFSKLCLANDLEEHERRRGTSLSIFCIACKKMIHNARQFRDHLMSAHVEEKEAAAGAGAAATSSVIAQSNLARLEFTGKNFPLVAKLYAEKSGRRQAAKDLPYFCEPCECSFMCKESLDMHLSEHAPNQSRLCEQCGTYAPTPELFQQHALAHESETVVAGFTKQSAGNVPEAIQDGISPQEFMLVLGMRPTENFVRKPQEVTKELTEIAACPSLASNTLSLDDNQNLVRVLSLGEQLPATQPEPSLAATQIIPSSSLLSILPKIPGRLTTAKPPNFETECSNSLAAAVPETSSDMCTAMLINKNMTVVPNVGSSSPAKCIDLNIPNRDFILPRITVTKVENGSESTGSGASGSSSSTKASLPFKCSECSYSSTDKSTLLRHERKHNGQRPFLCRLCDFAFTTKANCERHVRKKHPMREGQRIEDAIGYTRFAIELGAESTPRSMLETVCKFCGEDFKFYRALKHHLRSQTSCQYKPCQCKICSLRFSTKANCWRHLLKKHANETVGPIESYMFVNSRSRLDESHDPSIIDDEAGNCSNLLNMKVKEEVTLTLPGETVGVLNLQKNAPNVQYPVLADDNEDSDEPLDFSLKSNKSGVAVETRYTGRSETSNPWSCDEPMDLTVKGHCHQSRTSRESKTAMLSVVDALPFDLKLFAPRRESKAERLHASRVARGQASVLRSCLPFRFGSVSGSSSFSCAKCHLVFQHERELSAHLRTHHTSKVSVYRCSHCSCSFASRAQLDFHIKSRHPQFTDVTSSISPGSSSSSPSISLLKEPNNNSLELTNANLFLKPKYVKPSQLLSIAGDFASVPQILESTSGRQLKPILAINSSALVPAAAAKTIVHGQSNFESFAGHTFTITTAARPATTPIMVQKYDDEDDDSDKSDSVSEKNQNQETKETEQCTTESHVVKKKRNSYADSPHKLHCSFCSRAFPWISSLKRHLLTHTGQKPYRCKHCTVTFSTKSNRERHMIRKHGLDVHDPATRQTMDRPFKCHLCVFSSFTTSGKLLRHYISKHPDREIPESVTQSTGSQSQDESDRASRSCSSDPSFETSKLDQPADLAESLIDDDDDDESRGDETDEETKEVEELTNSLIRDMNQKAGNIIQSVASSAEVMSMVQLFAQEQQTTSSKPPSTSSDCLLLLSDKQHVNPERDNYNVDKITECWKCRKVFDCRKTLLRHLKEHSIDLPFKCYLCDASFEDRLISLTHKRDAHPTDWATVQDKNRVSDLADYADFMESVVRDTLDGKVTRRTHEGVELDIKPESDYAQRKVFCTLCPKRFWSLQDLRRHMRSHTGDRPFECDICFTRFTLKHSMMRHRRKHLNESAGTGAEAQCSGASDEDSGNTTSVAPTEGGSQLTEDSPDSSGDCNPSNVNILLAETELDISPNQLLVADVDLKSKTSSPEFKDRDSTEEARLVSPDQPDLLQSLLGIDDRSTIDRMLESPNNAASMLGIQRSARGESAA